MSQFTSKKKIFCIGLSRTGTTTFHQLMQDYGFRSIHTVWPLLSDNKTDVFENYDAFSDTPIPMMYKKCHELYPDAKFILTTRDKSKWLGSMKWMFKHGRIIWKWGPDLDEYHSTFYGTNTYDEKILSVHWDNFHRDVNMYFSTKKKQLFILDLEKVIDVKQLSEFLEIPHNNDIVVQWKNKRRKASLKGRLKYYLIASILTVIHKLRK